MARTAPGENYLTTAGPIEKPGNGKFRFIFRNFLCGFAWLASGGEVCGSWRERA